MGGFRGNTGPYNADHRQQNVCVVAQIISGQTPSKAAVGTRASSQTLPVFTDPEKPTALTSQITGADHKILTFSLLISFLVV